MAETAYGGACGRCLRELVQVRNGDTTVETYHPAEIMGAPCPDLIPLDCPCPENCLSLRVPDSNFIPEGTAP